MGYYNSGRRARELGIGSSGSLPSNPDLEYVFHDQKDLTAETLKKILGRNPVSYTHLTLPTILLE